MTNTRVDMPIHCPHHTVRAWTVDAKCSWCEIAELRAVIERLHAEVARWQNVADSYKQAGYEAEERQRLASEPCEPPANWQPIETAPKNGTHILALFHGQSYWPVRVLRWGGEHSLWGLPGHGGLEPTHWMPLPVNPTGMRTF